MERESSLKLTLFFLLIATLCSEAQLQFKYYSDPQQTRNWTDARSYCQRSHTDMLSWNTFSMSALVSHWRTAGNIFVWVGVHRDPEQPSVWRGINLKTGEGLSGDDLSQNTNWGNQQQTIKMCAYVSTNLMLYSEKCFHKFAFYCTHKDTIQYHNESVNWHTALKRCQKNGSVLATITESNKDNFSFVGWIGLFPENGKNWTCIGNSTSNYMNWAPQQLLPIDCVSFRTSKKFWISSRCNHHNRFVCYEDNLVMVNEKKTWEDALRHCREMDTSCVDDEGHPKHCYDLLSLTNSSHYGYVRDKIYRATTDEVWIGLRFLAGEWWWLNGERPEDQEMLPRCPSQWKHCGSISKYNTNSVNDQQSLIIKDCSERRNFICQESGNKWQNKDEFEGLK